MRDACFEEVSDERGKEKKKREKKRTMHERSDANTVARRFKVRSIAAFSRSVDLDGACRDSLTLDSGEIKHDATSEYADITYVNRHPISNRVSKPYPEMLTKSITRPAAAATY